MAGLATLSEVDSHWSWLDKELANEALDIRDEVEVLARELAEAKGG